jgi:hypothetical protein
MVPESGCVVIVGGTTVMVVLAVLLGCSVLVAVTV